MKKTKKIILIGVSVYVLAMILIYLGVSVFFMNHFYPKSIINGMDCSSRTVKEAESMIAEKVQDYSITILNRDGTKDKIEGTRMDFKYVPNGQIQKLKDSQNPLLWIGAYFNPKSYSMVAKTTYNKEVLKNSVEALDSFQDDKVTQPADAKIVKTGSSYQIEKEVEGNQVDKEKTMELLYEGVDRGDTEMDLQKLDCYIKPAVYSDDEKLTTKLNVLNKYSDMKITYQIGDAQEVIDSDTIQQWMTLDEDANPSFSEDAVADYVSGLSSKYDTYGVNVSFHTSLGEEVSVENVTYGWCIDGAGEREQLMNDLKAGESVDREPVYSETAWTHEGSGIGDTYVEIDYGSQHMWYYKDGALVIDTDVVTGNPNKGNASPVGVFCLVDKERNATLVGEDYRTPVSYWMPYYDGVGIHDADWQPVFGGNRYLTFGSHGCINTPINIVSVIYDNIEIGTPIVCYQGSVVNTQTTAPETVNAETGTADSTESETSADNVKNTDNTDNTESGDTPAASDPSGTSDTTAQDTLPETE